MTFVKPSSVTVQTGAYAYKGGVTSASMDYIDNSFPNILDTAGGGTITGPITLDSILTLGTGGFIVIPVGTEMQVGGEILFSSSRCV